jgi:hypothetical protein
MNVNDLELQKLESIFFFAPNEKWDTFNDERYYRRCGDRWYVWIYDTEVWSVPICNPPIDFINRKDIEKQINHLKEINKLNSLIGDVVNSRDGDINTVDGSLATVGLNELIHLESYFQGNG